MKRSIILLFCIASFLFANAQTSAPLLPVKPDYLQHALKYYKSIQDLHKEKVLSILTNSEVAYSLFVVTKEDKYLRDCNRYMTFIFDDWKTNPNNIRQMAGDFFFIYPACFAYDGLRQSNLVQPEWYDLMKKFIGYANTGAMGDHNQVYARTAGLAYGIKIFPDHPQAKQINKYIERVWNQWYPNKDVNENANHYCGIGIRDIIRIAKLTDREYLFKDVAIQKWIHRFRDIIAPSGAMPEVGDDYFFGEWEPWLSNFDYFAKVFNDATLIEAAWRLFASGSKNQSSSAMLFSDYILNQVEDMVPVSAGTQSLITTRSLEGGKTALDKMILGYSRTPGTPMVNTELYGYGSHGHPNRIGAIQYYETNNAPFMHNMKRRQTDARFGNLVAVLPNGANPIPSNSTATNTGIAKTNIWYSQICETKFMKPADLGIDSPKRKISYMTLRLPSNSKNEIDIMVDHFRLESADGSKTISLELCESLDNWKRRDNPYSLTDDCKEGKHSVKIQLKNKANQNAFYGFKLPSSIEYNCQEYPYLKFDWKQECEGKEETNLWFIARLEGFDYNVGSMDKEAKVKSAEVNMSGKDSYGKIALTDYRFTGSNVTSTLIRKQVLTEEGILVVQDELTPNEKADGYFAASLWNLYTKGESGENWFDTPGEAARKNYDPVTGQQIQQSLLVYFNKNQGRSYSADSYNVGGDDRFSFYAKQNLSGNNPVKFISVLVPHKASEKPEAIVKNITVSQNKNLTEISIKYPVVLKVQIGTDGSWKVSR